jgi:transaldolase
VVNRIDTPVNPAIVGELYKKFADFRRAYDENGLTVDEFDTYPCTVRTLRQFIAATTDLGAVIRDFMLPNPDKK